MRYVELSGDDHWLSSASTRTQVLQEIEAFLATVAGQVVQPEQAMARLRTALISTLGLACALCGAAAQADSGALKQKVDAVIDQAIAEDRIVGAVVLVAQDGKLVYERAAGLVDKESRKPMQVDALFRLSSVSKPIVTVAALALVERKKLSLDDPVTKWLPDFKPKLADGTTPTITVRQLLTHTAGLGYKFTEKADGPYHKAQISDGFDDVKIDLAEEMRRLASVPLLSTPGSQWRYSLSIDVLGAVIERAAGKPLGTVVADLVTKPLGMKGTSFVVDRAHADRVATAYFNAPSGTAPMADPQVIPFGTMTLVVFTITRLRREGVSLGGRRHDRQRARRTAIARSGAQGRRTRARQVDRRRRCFAIRSQACPACSPASASVSAARWSSIRRRRKHRSRWERCTGAACTDTPGSWIQRRRSLSSR